MAKVLTSSIVSFCQRLSLVPVSTSYHIRKLRFQGSCIPAANTKYVCKRSCSQEGLMNLLKSGWKSRKGNISLVNAYFQCHQLVKVQAMPFREKRVLKRCFVIRDLIKLILQQKAAAGSCFVKRCSWKFCKVRKKRSVPESLF